MDWTFAQRSAEENLILLQPALGRLAGDYPQEFRTKQQTKGDSFDGEERTTGL